MREVTCNEAVVGAVARRWGAIPRSSMYRPNRCSALARIFRLELLPQQDNGVVTFPECAGGQVDNPRRVRLQSIADPLRGRGVIPDQCARAEPREIIGDAGPGIPVRARVIEIGDECAEQARLLLAGGAAVVKVEPLETWRMVNSLIEDSASAKRGGEGSVRPGARAHRAEIHPGIIPDDGA
jgi:hypothetical protein